VNSGRRTANTVHDARSWSGWLRRTEPDFSSVEVSVATVLLLCLLLLTGCVHPIGADRTSIRQAHKQIAASALNDQLSAPTRMVLHAFELEEAFADEPAATLKLLHEKACHDDRRDLLYALAELNYLHAEHLRRSVKPGAARGAPDYYLSATIYAWFYLLGQSAEPPPSAFDWRFRVACDLYNCALGQAFADGPRTNSSVRLAGGVRPLLPGNVEVALSRPGFNWGFDEIDRFLPANEFTVRGLTVRDRQSGLGAPLIVVGKTLESKRGTRRFPATLILRVPGDVRQWSAGSLHASLELYSAFQTNSIEVGGNRIPLEGDMTAPLAYALNDASLWKLGAAQFFSSDEMIKSDIYLTQPYEPGRVPVIFVHGTFSSPIWWAEMWNTLRADSELRKRCQFWYFLYNSGNPVGMTAAKLREAINRKIEQLDPGGNDPALRQMVLVGHSQGGLLTKLTVTDTGDKLWRAVSNKDFEQINLHARAKEELRRHFFLTPLPSVKRVIFVSTPHRGSYLATSFVRSLAIKLMKMPRRLVNASLKAMTLQNPLGLKSAYERRVPTSVDGMSPTNPWLLALADIPVASGVKAHSIIAIKGNDQPPAGGDGVVKYTSAHVPYVESEFIVRSGHSCQDKPATIEEVRRILIDHLASLPSAGGLNVPERSVETGGAKP
jgi:pimeloyl-ACP methyl ester carboxylesterase